jgi:uncharacterized protein
MKNYSSPRPAPQRTCTACRQVKDKRAMLRLVRTPAGKLEIDSSGKKEGRGAYLCRDAACWEKALKSNQLEHAFKNKLNQSDLERIYQEAKDLLKESTSGESR